jgi:hypothetical protein
VPRLSDADQFISIKSVYIAAATTYQAALWNTDPGNMASISAITQVSGATFNVTTSKIHGLTTGLPTAITGVTSSGGGGAGTLQTLINAGTFTAGATPGALTPTVIDTFNFHVTLSGTPSDPAGYSSGGTAGAGGELNGGSGPYSRASITFQGADPQVNNNGLVSWSGVPAVNDPGPSISTLYVVIWNVTASRFAGAGTSNIIHEAVTPGAVIQAPLSQIIGAIS